MPQARFSALAIACGLAVAGGVLVHAGEPVPSLEPVPALETYADWPPRELSETAYWLPWSRTTFQRASFFARPVFFELTVGWSRAAQQFDGSVLTDPRVLRELNRAYLSVRANADLRPDLRERYQTGAWPAVALVLPQGLPMLSRAQERDLAQVQPITATALDVQALEFFLREGWIYWSRWDGLLMEMGELWAKAKRPVAPTRGELDASRSELVERWMLGNADRQGGGFGLVPKYFAPWVLEYAAALDRRGRADLAGHARASLETLVASPLFDEVEGGLHRLAAAPSFGEVSYEKLLEPNAGLLRELDIALGREDSPRLGQALGRTVDFLLRVLESERGGFYLAQAADPTSPDGGGFWHAGGQGPRPPLDPLVLSGPSAMAGSALVRAGQRLGREDAITAGKRALERVLAEAYRPGRGVVHALEPASAENELYLVTQASCAFAFVDAYEALGEERYLAAARDVARAALANLRVGDEDALRDRLPLPSDAGLLLEPRWPMRANVRLARALLHLSRHDGDASWHEEAARITASFTSNPGQYEVHGAELALAIEEWLAREGATR